MVYPYFPNVFKGKTKLTPKKKKIIISKYVQNFADGTSGKVTIAEVGDKVIEPKAEITSKQMEHRVRQFVQSARKKGKYYKTQYRTKTLTIAGPTEDLLLRPNRIKIKKGYTFVKDTTGRVVAHEHVKKIIVKPALSIRQQTTVKGVTKIPGVERIILTLTQDKKKKKRAVFKSVEGTYRDYGTAIRQTGIMPTKEFRTKFGFQALKKMPTKDALEVIRERFTYPEGVSKVHRRKFKIR